MSYPHIRHCGFQNLFVSLINAIQILISAMSWVFMRGGEWARMDWLPVWTDIEIKNMDFWLLNPLMAPTELFWSIEQILPTSWIIDLPELQSHCAQSCCQVCSFCSHAKNLYVLLRKCTTYNDSYFLLLLSLPLHKIWYIWALPPKLSFKFRSLVY